MRLAHRAEKPDLVASLVKGDRRAALAAPVGGPLGTTASGEFHVIDARPGDLLKMPKNVPHGVWQKGDTATRTLWVVVPAGKMQDLLTALGQLPANQPPDPVQVGQIFAEHDLTLLPPPGN